jgi:hypothetical protein
MTAGGLTEELLARAERFCRRERERGRDVRRDYDGKSGTDAEEARGGSPEERETWPI